MANNKTTDLYLTERAADGGGELIRGYRRGVPEDVRAKVGKREWVKSFGAVPKHEALREIAKLASVHDNLIKRLRNGGEITLDENAARAVEAEAQALMAKGKSGDDALDEFFSAAFGRWLERHADRYAAARAQQPSGRIALPLEPLGLDSHERAVIAAVDAGGRYVPAKIALSEAYARDKRLHVPAAGRDERPYALAVSSFTVSQGDMDLRSIHREHVIQWIADCRAKDQADNTIRRRAECLSAIWKRWHKDYGIVAANPFAELKLSAGKKAEAKLPFARVHLEAIDAYIAKATGKRKHAKTHVIWTLLKHTGARPAEIAGLMPEDVFLDDAVPFVWIRPNALRRLKTASSARMIPLVGEALEVMREVMKAPAGRGVFYPDDFKWQNVSDALNMGLRRVGIARGRLSAGSYRHTMKAALRVAGIREDLQRYALGHAGGAVADNYGAPDALLEELRDAFEKALPKLGEVNLRIFKPAELEIKPKRRTHDETLRKLPRVA